MPEQSNIERRETDQDVPVMPEEGNASSVRIKSRATYFKEIQRRAGRMTDAESQRAAERQRQSSNSKGLPDVNTSRNSEHTPLRVEVCHGGRYVNRECVDGRHRIDNRRSDKLAERTALRKADDSHTRQQYPKRPHYNNKPWRSHTYDKVHHPSHVSSRKDERTGSPSNQGRMPDGFFGVSSRTLKEEKSKKKAVNTVFCIHCGKNTPREHAEEHKFQQMAEEFDQPEMSEVDFITTTPVQQENPVEEPTTSMSRSQRTDVAEEEAIQKMRDDLIKQANWMKLQNFMFNEATSEEEVIRSWCAKHVKTNTSFRYMRANPVQAKKIVAFLLRIKEKIKGDEEMMRAWRERLQ